MRLFIASLSHYNSGELKGGWIDLPSVSIRDKSLKFLKEQKSMAFLITKHHLR